jgi:cytochrome c-type biogenesis protein CcmE
VDVIGPRPDLDLTPREPEPPRARRASRRSLVSVVIVVVLAALGFVLFKGLTNATLYYRNADEAVADKAALGSSRFRIQGVVQNDVEQTGDEIDFSIAFNGVTVPVQYSGGEPTALFKPCVPVVLEGRWQGAVFAGDRILIKHSATYTADHPDRVTTGTSCPSS